MGADNGFNLVHHINATEYLTYQGGKFSKSQNRGVFGDQAIDTGIPSSVWRFYLLSVRPESADANFSWSDLADKANGELNNNVGNLVSRIFSFISSKYDGVVPSLGVIGEEEENFVG